METTPGAMVDPAYSRFLEAGTDEPYFVNLASMNIVRSAREFPLSRGGILCEQMGVGKTLMCLVLVLVSLHQHTRPPLDAGDVTDIVTDEELRTYSTDTAHVLRMALNLGEEPELGAWSTDDLQGTPSLASMCADIVSRVYPGAAREEDLSPSAKALIERPCFFYRLPPPVRLPRGAKAARRAAAEKLLLAPTTLVVVPPILVPQWLDEAEKHLSPGALRIKVIGEGKEELPPVTELVKYDVSF